MNMNFYTMMASRDQISISHQTSSSKSQKQFTMFMIVLIIHEPHDCTPNSIFKYSSPILLSQMLLVIYTFIFSYAYIYLINNHSFQYINLTTATITSAFWINYHHNTPIQQKILNRLINSELIHQIAYTVWLYCIHPTKYIYYVPLMLSNIGKIFILVHGKCQKYTYIIEQIIDFQIKSEFFILFLQIVKYYTLPDQNLYPFLILFILCKIKYSLYYPAQRSFTNWNLSLDSCAKKANFRKCYHSLTTLIMLFNDTYNTSKEISY